jgi:hypothetical protein
MDNRNHAILNMSKNAHVIATHDNFSRVTLWNTSFDSDTSESLQKGVTFEHDPDNSDYIQEMGLSDNGKLLAIVSRVTAIRTDCEEPIRSSITQYGKTRIRYSITLYDMQQDLNRVQKITTFELIPPVKSGQVPSVEKVAFSLDNTKIIIQLHSGALYLYSLDGTLLGMVGDDRQYDNKYDTRYMKFCLMPSTNLVAILCTKKEERDEEVCQHNGIDYYVLLFDIKLELHQLSNVIKIPQSCVGRTIDFSCDERGNFILNGQHYINDDSQITEVWDVGTILSKEK